MILNLLILSVSIFLIIKGSIWATKYSAQLARNYKLSKYTVGFIIISIISILPEALVSVNSAIKGIPSFGLGTLLGTNIADLTLVFAIIILLAKRSIKIESKIIKNNIIYPFILLIPIILGLDGHFSRLEGVTLIITGCLFYYIAFKNNMDHDVEINDIEKSTKLKNAFFLIGSMLVLLLGAHFVVTSSVSLATQIGIRPIFIGIFIIGLGTVIPELLFSIESVKNNNDSLAIGDILGTVLADGTVVIGLISLIKPFSFSKNIIYITGLFMVVSAFLLFYFMKSGRTLTKKEAILLFAFWILFILVEISFNI